MKRGTKNRWTKNTKANSKGITLIALVVTIVVLLILAGVSLSLVIGDSGIITRALDAVEQTKKAEAEETVMQLIAEWQFEYVVNGTSLGDFLQSKVPDVIDDVSGDETSGYEVTIGDYIITVSPDGTMGETESASGTVPEVSYELTQTDGTALVDGTKYDSIVAKVTIGNFSEFTGVTMTVTNTSGETNTENVSSSEVSVTITSNVTIKVTGTTAEGSRTKTIVVDATGKINEPEKVTVTGTNGTILTKDNYAQYLGRIVTNYKTEGGTETVTTTTSNYSSVNTFTVSTTYRLYYIDFEGKYGDAGTVYLKADCTANNYTLSTSLAYNTTTSKIKSLNPSLYASGVTTPTTSNSNMKAVTWLLDTNEWSGLVTSGASTAIADKVNYVVGAPSFEMFCDSYNAYYGLTGDTPSEPTGSSTVTERRKIFYYYPYNTNNYGYAVGPGYSSGTVTNYNTYSSYYLVLSDSDIDSMYYPGSSQYYWLASPSAHYSYYVMNVNYSSGGRVNYSGYDNCNAFCPLVSLQSDVQLELE